MPKEVFLIENCGRVALFAPLRGLIMEVRENEKERVLNLMTQPNFSFGDLHSVFLEMEKSRLFEENTEEPNLTESNGEFRPDSVVLFTTSDCNLRCIYCYAAAGERKIHMSQRIAETAIDFVIRNAKLKGRKECSLEFHGGGEPTWNWPVFKSALDYFQRNAEQNGLTPEVSLATNGMLSKTQIDWIASHMQGVQVSLDGMKEIQNSQRPTAGGKESFSVVSKSIQSLLAKGVKVTIHSVITEMGVSRIPEIVLFFATNFPGTTVHMEPACECGRGLSTGQKFPSPTLFIEGFIEAQKIAERFGMEVFYSGARPQLTEFHKNFCGVSTPNFVVTPTGLVTACHEVAEREHPLADYFIYGYLNHQSGNFVFDCKKIENLRRYVAEIDPACQECFCRYYCAGDCLAKNLSNEGERKAPFLNPRCEINRELTKHYVFGRLFTDTEKEESHEDDRSKHQEPASLQRRS